MFVLLMFSFNKFGESLLLPAKVINFLEILRSFWFYFAILNGLGESFIEFEEI